MNYKEAIVIYRKDNRIIALDKRTNIFATAICSPEDACDFMTGAELAFDRLKEKVVPKFKVGDIVIGNEKANKTYAYTRKGAIGKVRAIFDKSIAVDFISSTLDGTPCTTSFDVDPDCFDLVEFKEDETEL